MAEGQYNSQEIEKNIGKKLFRNLSYGLMLAFVGFVAVVWAFVKFSSQFAGKADWQLLEGFASLLSLVLLMGGATFATTEYFNKERARVKEEENEERAKKKLSYDIYQAIFAKITDPEQEAARRWILQNIEPKRTDENLTEWFERENKKVVPDPESREVTEGQKAIKLTLNAFDYIGFIADHFWEVDDDALDWISAPIAKVWDRLGPYVEQVQNLRGVNDYYASAQSIGQKCIGWREAKGWLPETIAKNTP